ncbi:MAG: hypothetical protein KC496_00885, partial [Anaerolineae bacterium]|nr:hypothetical protein [Anaerolineae bacterium]
VYQHVTSPIMGADAIAALASAREAMVQQCTQLALRCYDPTEMLREHAVAGEALYYSDDMHLNPHGNAILAEDFAAWLAQNDLLP